MNKKGGIRSKSEHHTKTKSDMPNQSTKNMLIFKWNLHMFKIIYEYIMILNIIQGNFMSPTKYMASVIYRQGVNS